MENDKPIDKMYLELAHEFREQFVRTRSREIAFLLERISYCHDYEAALELFADDSTELGGEPLWAFFISSGALVLMTELENRRGVRAEKK